MLTPCSHCVETVTCQQHLNFSVCTLAMLSPYKCLDSIFLTELTVKYTLIEVFHTSESCLNIRSCLLNSLSEGELDIDSLYTDIVCHIRYALEHLKEPLG